MASSLSKRERACLTCPLDDCHPESDKCPQRVMERAEKAARMRKARATRNMGSKHVDLRANTEPA